MKKREISCGVILLPVNRSSEVHKAKQITANLAGRYDPNHICFAIKIGKDVTIDGLTLSVFNTQFMFIKNHPFSRSQLVLTLFLLFCTGLGSLVQQTVGQEEENSKSDDKKLVLKPDLFKPLTEPPCSYCIDQHAKGFVESNDPVLAWIRGAHNGGAFPLKYFIAKQRVINDTYGLFFYDPDGGYIASFKKDYGYRFHGWRGGVMLVKSSDGTVWSALTGKAISGPQKGTKLTRVPSMQTTWGHWLLLHPESTAYDLFDGKKYPLGKLPIEISAEAEKSIGTVDKRLDRFSKVIGIEGKNDQLAVSLNGLEKRDCVQVELEEKSVAVFWYEPTGTAVAFDAELDGRELHFYADEISPRTAPFKDRETGSRWTLAGRAVDGPLRGKELTWAPSIQCRWYAWSHEYPETKVFPEPKKDDKVSSYQGVVLSAKEASADTIEKWNDKKYRIVLYVDQVDEQLIKAAKLIETKQDKVEYFFEIARNVELAEKNPRWMASLQGHENWLRLYPDFKKPNSNEVVKNYPWVPIFYQEAFDAHLSRIQEALKQLPAPARIWLNDVQGAPSACGCGHPLCRWTADYGPIKTATTIGDLAPAKFAAAVKKLSPETKVVPIFASECEEDDHHAVCDGVHCFQGICWKAFARQLDAVATVTSQVGVACYYKEWKRDLERYGEKAAWTQVAIESFEKMPPKRGGRGVAPDRLLAVLQGWNVNQSEIDQQIKFAQQAEASGLSNLQG